MSNIEERRTENCRTEESKENWCGNKIIGDIFAAHFRQSLAKYSETFAQFEWKMGVTGQYPAPGEFDGSAKILLLFVKCSYRGDLHWIDQKWTEWTNNIERILSILAKGQETERYLLYNIFCRTLILYCVNTDKTFTTVFFLNIIHWKVLIYFFKD